MYKINIKFSDGKHRVERAATMCYATVLLHECEMKSYRSGRRIFEVKIWRSKNK